MLHDFKEAIENYSIIGLIIAVLTAIIRPYNGLMQTLREGLIVVIFNVLSGLILENWSDIFSEPMRYGISGLVGFFAVKIYLIVCSVSKRLQEHPEIITDRGKKAGGSDDGTHF